MSFECKLQQERRISTANPPKYKDIFVPVKLCPSISLATSMERSVGLLPGPSRKRKRDSEFDGESFTPLSDLANALTPRVLIVLRGEDIAEKIKSIMQQEQKPVCIISATGAIASVNLIQPSSSPFPVTYEVSPGCFQILTLRGSFFPNNGHNCLTVSLSNPDGSVFGGVIGDRLIAARSVQVVVTILPLDYSTFKIHGDGKSILGTNTSLKKDGKPETNNDVKEDGKQKPEVMRDGNEGVRDEDENPNLEINTDAREDGNPKPEVMRDGNEGVRDEELVSRRDVEEVRDGKPETDTDEDGKIKPGINGDAKEDGKAKAGTNGDVEEVCDGKPKPEIRVCVKEESGDDEDGEADTRFGIWKL